MTPTTNAASVVLPPATSSRWLDRPLRIITTPAEPPRTRVDVMWMRAEVSGHLADGGAGMK